MSDVRYGIYFLPPEGSALAAFGAAWLGWDVAGGQVVAHPKVSMDVAAWTATPRTYGFHGTLKPPFRLAHSRTEAELTDALAKLAKRHRAFHAPSLRLATLGSFLALVPTAPSPELAELAADCVQALDDFRRPAEEAELARRRAAGLAPRQEEMLARWGYPYVLEEFRFHLTLTGRLDRGTALAAEAVLKGLTRNIIAQPLEVREVCIVAQVDGAPFKLMHRYPLTG